MRQIKSTYRVIISHSLLRNYKKNKGIIYFTEWGAENYRIPFSVIPLNWLAKLLSPYVYGCVVFISCEKLEHMLGGKRLCH